METTGAHVEVGEAEFCIQNFAATCELTETVSDGLTNYREIVSGPLIKLHNLQFAIGVSWAVHNEGQKNLKKNIGVFVTKLNSHVKQVCTVLHIEIVNKESQLSKRLQDSDFVRWTSKCQGWSPSFGDGKNSSGVQMAELLDDANGWLHEKALRVRARIKLAVLDATNHGQLEEEDKCREASKAQSQVCEDLKALLASGKLADLAIKVGAERFQVHSAVLAARSPFFMAMLSSPMKESHDKEVILTDLPADAVKSLLFYLYTGCIDGEVLADDQAAKGLLQAAHRFQVRSLVKECVDALVSRLTTDNVVSMLEFADLFACEDFKRPCLLFIQVNLCAVQSTAGYGHLLQRPKLLQDIIAAVTPPAVKKRRLA